MNIFDLDVVGGSVHFLDGEDVVSRRSAWGRGQISTADVYPKYLGVLESMLDYDYFDVIYYLDMLKKYNQRPSPSAVHGFLDVLEKIREKGLAVELNTSGFHYPVKEAFPSPDTGIWPGSPIDGGKSVRFGKAGPCPDFPCHRGKGAQARVNTPDSIRGD